MTQSFEASHGRCKIQILINLKYIFYMSLVIWQTWTSKNVLSKDRQHEYFVPFIQSYIALGLLMMELYSWYRILSKYSFPHNTFLGPFAINWRHCFFSSLKALFLSQSEVYRLKCPSDHSMSSWNRKWNKVFVFLKSGLQLKESG